MSVTASKARGARLARAFIKKVKSDSSLWAKIAAAEAESNDKNATIAGLIAIAADAGFHFNFDDYEEAVADEVEEEHSSSSGVDICMCCCSQRSNTSSSSAKSNG